MYDRDELTGAARPGPGAGTSTTLLDRARDIYDDNDLDDHVNRMCLADAGCSCPGLNLAYTDRSSMAASTEVRVPFVDPRSFEAAFSLAGSDRRSVAGSRRPP